MTLRTSDLGDDALVNTRDAAAFLCIRPTTLNWYRSHGGGPTFVKVGRAVRYRLSDLRAYVQTVEPRARMSHVGEEK